MNLKRLSFSLAVMLALVTASSAFAATIPEQIFSDAKDMLQEISKQDDVSGMADTLRGSYAVAIVPSMVKAGFLIGGTYGEGFILRREKGKWYGPSFYNVGGASFGLQAGAQEIALLMAVINERGVEAFLSSKTKLGGDVSVAAGPVGRRAEAATDAQAKASIYSYSISKGLFAGLSLDGSVISISVKRNKEYWGEGISASDALQKPAEDKRITPITKMLDELIKKANAKESDEKKTPEKKAKAK